MKKVLTTLVCWLTTGCLTISFAGNFDNKSCADSLASGSLDFAEDSIAVSSVLDTTSADSLPVARKREGFVRKIINYFARANKPNPDKRVDFGVLPGPHYSSTAGLGLGIMASATYSMDRTDSLLPRSNASLFTDMTTKGFLLLGLRGNNIFPHERFRLDYRVYIYTFPTEFWGIGYENGNNDENETDYRRLRFDVMGRFLVRVAPNTYIGPMVNFRYIKATEVDPAENLPLFAGQDLKVSSRTVGLSFTYDSRDFMLNARRGWFVQLDQSFTPRFLGNDYCFSTTDLTLCTYRQVWKGGVLAGEFHGALNYGKPAWCLLSEVGSTSRMRGYYEGRYRDKDILEAQVELRQHIKGRNGIAVWLGAAEVFPRFTKMSWDRVLPNGGFGYRWEFKKRINVRLDLGFGKNGPGVMFNINEAF